MILWWESLTTFQQILGLIGIAATLILVIQLVLSLFGLFGSFGAGDSGISNMEDLDGDGFPDIDLDGDGIPDIDLNGDGIPDTDLNSDGLADTLLDVHYTGDGAGSFHNSEHTSFEHSDFAATAFGLSDILTFRGIVSFFSIFSWLTLALTENNVPTILALIIGAIAGFLIMFLIGYLFFRIKYANYSGTLDIRNAIGLKASVYLRIPANETGIGKVQMTVQSRYAELDAVTRWPQEIATGETVRVVSVRRDGVLVVEPTVISKNIELRL